MEDLKKTQHYTTKSEEICLNLIDDIPQTALLIEPFVGQGDLLNLFPNHTWKTYDLKSTNKNTIIQDTLKNPPDYKGYWVITNPPYLAKNKATDKTLFVQYGLDDLYKISIKTILASEGGILIVPTNFFTDERSSKIRIEFFEKFKILKLNIFTEPIFESTTYSVCSFSFVKKAPNEKIIFPTFLPQKGKKTEITLNREYGYRLAGEFYHKVEKVKPIFERLREGIPPNGFITNIKLFALDTRGDKIRLSFEEEPFYGKATDRVYATFVSKVKLSEEEQKKIIEGFNLGLNRFREEFLDIPLTNYRDYNRKRIGFDFAYKYATLFYNK